MVGIEDWKLREVDPELAQRYRDEGFWTGETLGQLLGAQMRSRPDNRFVVHSDVRPARLTWAELEALVRRVAGGLRARGIGPGDRVAFQTPNWIEGVATFYASCYLGAVIVPIVHFYGPKEVAYILGRTGVKAFVMADRFGHQDFLANYATFEGSLPDLEWVGVVGEVPSGFIEFSSLAAADPIDGPEAVDPDTPALVAYTSGTTSDPKGVVHTHRTINAEIRQLARIQGTGNPPLLNGAPIGHGIGMLAALLLPVYRGESVQLIDVWDPARVLALMLEEDVYAGSGATYFALSLVDHPDFTDRHAKLMRTVGLGGSAVPAAVTERLDALGMTVFRSFGSTEHPSITGCSVEDAREKRLYTDGKAMPGCEFRIVDDAGVDVPDGTPGEIWSRGPECFAGYTVPELTEQSFTGSWYMTGDIGVRDADGYLQITDRKKDVIIRGGENVSPAEVEEQLLRMPGVAEVAVVAKPHEKLNEVGCAYLRLLPGTEEFTIDDMRAHLEKAGIARQKWPEDLRFVTDFPRTASGKVQKFRLRQELRAE